MTALTEIHETPDSAVNVNGAQAGRAALEFARVSGRTVLRRSFAASPLKLLNPRGHSVATEAAWVYTSSYGGGLLGGDHLNLCVRVRAGASALLTTQASTKVYKSDRIARQTVSATIDDDALLVVAPDPLVCFAGSKYVQEQEYRLSATANLVLVDWLNAGRRANGERWMFDHYSSRISIWRGNHKMFYDSTLLDPAHGDIAVRLGRFNTLLMAVICGPKLTEAAQGLLNAIAQLQPKLDPQIVLVASPIKNSGALLRVAAVSVEEAGCALRRYLSFIGPLIGDDPWARKR